MNNKVNYTFVGLVVMTGIVLMLLFTYWMMRSDDDSVVQDYVIYFNESVVGLNLDAPVKFRGINVGRVKRLRVNPNNTEQVEVLVTILQDTPVKDNIVAVLTAQGITGLTYINLTVGKTVMSQKTVEIEDEHYVVIPSAPSFFSNVSESMTRILVKIDKMMNDKNQAEVMRLVSSSADVMGRIDTLLDDKTLRHLQNTARNIDNATTKINVTLDNVNNVIEATIAWEKNIHAAFYSISQSYKKIDAAMGEFHGAISRGDFNLEAITSEFMPTLKATLLQLQGVMVQMKDTLKEVQRSPSDLLFKKEELNPAPGEE